MKNYKFEIDKWYIVNETVAGKIDKGLELGTIGDVKWFDNEQEWQQKCKEYEIEIDSDSPTI